MASFAYGCASAAHNLLKSFWAVSGIANDINYPFPLLGMLFLAACFGAGQMGCIANALSTRPHSNQNQPLLLAMGIGLLAHTCLVLRFGYLFGMGQGGICSRSCFPSR